MTDKEEITLSMVFNKLNEYRNELVEKVDKSKTEIFDFVKRENKALREQLNSLKRELAEKNEIISSFKNELDDVKADDVSFLKEFVKAERDVADMQQYTRRNNIEVAGIPDSVENSVLEQTIINIAELMRVNISKSDFEACHRLSKRKNENGPSRVICRFVNRKTCEALLVNSKLLKNKTDELLALGIENSIFINNNLCNYYKLLWG